MIEASVSGRRYRHPRSKAQHVDSRRHLLVARDTVGSASGDLARDLELVAATYDNAERKTMVGQLRGDTVI